MDLSQKRARADGAAGAIELTDEVWRTCFSFLYVRELYSAANVCKQWRDCVLQRTPVLFVSNIIRSSPRAAESLYGWLSRLNLSQVKIFDAGLPFTHHISPILLVTCLARMQSLTSLSLRFPTSQPAPFFESFRLLSPLLHCLRVSFTGSSPSTIAVDAALFQHCAKLEELDMYEIQLKNTHLLPASLTMLSCEASSPFSPLPTSLRKLYLQTGSTKMAWHPDQREMTNLKQLHLEGENLKHPGNILDLSPLPALKWLRFEFRGSNKECTAQLLACVPPTVQQLQLCEVTKMGLYAFRGLANATSLERLVLGIDSYDDAHWHGCLSLQPLRSSCPALKCITIVASEGREPHNVRLEDPQLLTINALAKRGCYVDPSNVDICC